MPPSIADLAFARETTARLLEELGLQNYLFDVEPRDGEYVLTVECAAAGAWETTTIAVDAGQLQAARGDRAAYRELLGELHSRLAACAVQAAPMGAPRA